MPATAADLSTHLQSIPPLDRALKVLTNFGTTSATTINTTVLLQYCSQAIEWFENDFGTYDPDTSRWHRDLTRYKVLQLLYGDTNNPNKVKEYEEKMAPLIERIRGQRTTQPATNSPYTPTVLNTNGRVVRPDFDDSAFDGYSARNG